MNHPVLQSSSALPAPSARERAAIQSDRAQTELRHGRPLVIVGSAPDAALLLVSTVETLTAERLGWLLAAAAANGVEPRLLLTAERLRALGCMQASTARAMRVATPWTLERLQQLAAVSPGAADGSLLEDPQAAGASMEAAIGLAKRARLIPALLTLELPGAVLPALQAARVLAWYEADAAAAPAVDLPRLLRVSDAQVPIAVHEDCQLVLFREIDGDVEHVAILVGTPRPDQPVPVRLHSSCLTGDLLGSLRCDCGDQLRRAIDHLAEVGGVLLYLSQEGRGTGLANKLRAYRLQDGGLDTIEADRHLGFRGDERDFGIAVAMLRALGIERITLLTNNPSKITALRRGGIEVAGRLPLIAPVNRHNSRYLRTKRERAGHLHPDDEQVKSPPGGADLLVFTRGILSGPGSAL